MLGNFDGDRLYLGFSATIDSSERENVDEREEYEIIEDEKLRSLSKCRLNLTVEAFTEVEVYVTCTYVQETFI